MRDRRREARAAYPVAEQAIARHLGGLHCNPRNARVAAYAAIGDEIDAQAIADILRWPVALPRIVARGQPLLFHAVDCADALVTGVFGISEPKSTAPVVEPCVILVPLLAFDLRGYRLGYGGGYYDRTLAACRARGPVTAIGLAFDSQKVDACPCEAYDERLDLIVTPTRVFRIGAAGA